MKCLRCSKPLKRGKHYCSYECERIARATQEERKKGLRPEKFHPWRRSIATHQFKNGVEGEFKPKTKTVEVEMLTRIMKS